MKPFPKRVVVIERHPIVRERLAELLATEAAIQHCGEADSLKTGMALVVSTRPALAITGLSLKDSNGLDLVKQIKALSLPTAVLVLSGHNEDLYANRVLAAGAMGFVSKDSPSAEILAAISKVLSGVPYLSSRMTNAVLHTLATRRIAAPIGRSITQLSDRELEVLEKIGEGKTPCEISMELGLSRPSLDTYRARIKEKLNLRNAVELLSFAIRWVDSL